ncbi:MAG: DegV family protein [Anaerolineae bacterium]|nr:DegV family protein [Anaerolineae bacterium]
MTKIAVVTDSSAHIPSIALEGLDVSVIPLWLFWDGDRFRDGVDMDPPTFYRRLKESKTLPVSSQPSVGEFEIFFRQLGAEDKAIVSVLASSKISGTVSSAQAAQEHLPDLTIRVVDSLSSSMGQGFVVLAAARAAAAGQSLDQVVAAAEEMRAKVHFLFVVDTLEYLRRGGRIGRIKWLMGTVLQIKPILHFLDGQITPLSQARTKHKAIAQILETIHERLGGSKMAEVAVADVDCPLTGDQVAELVRDQFGPAQIHRAEVSPVVGTHVGPGTIGIAFYAG